MASIFTRIINGELPGEIVYETAGEVALLDINPLSDGHTLVVPKLEVANFDELPPAHLHGLMATAQHVVRGVTRAMGTPHYNLILNNGPAAGQVVFHVHLHIVPRYPGVRRDAPRSRLGEADRVRFGARIRQALAELGEG